VFSETEQQQFGACTLVRARAISVLSKRWRFLLVKAPQSPEREGLLADTNASILKRSEKRFRLVPCYGATSRAKRGPILTSPRHPNNTHEVAARPTLHDANP
jgi:hypothetical protein